MKRAELVECPVCHVAYLELGLIKHLSQMAGKEAQYHLADLVYEALELSKGNHQMLIPGETVKEVLKDCPHWKYLLKNQKKVDTRPVKKKKI